MKKNSIQYWGMIGILLLFLQSHAFAHAFLDHSNPKVGSAVVKAPDELKIWFTQNVEPAFSVIEVKNANGVEVDKKNTHLDAKNPSLLIVSLPNLPAGIYKVSWHVVSVDTHRTQGHFEFTVR